MKWNNKGHQFDEVGEKLTKMFKEKDGVWIFGAGIYGKDLRTLFSKYEFSCFKGFIDNNANKKNEITDCEVCLFDEYIDRGGNDWIVIAAEGVHVAEIQKQLEDKGKIKNEDFFDIDYFLSFIFPVISMYAFDKLYTRIGQISVTERCTLKCKKCAHGCYAVDNSRDDMNINDVFISSDYFFKAFDYVTEFSLLGGEPLLYKELIEAIEYIGSEYRNQMVTFSVTSNGTIFPSDQLIDVMKKHEMLYRISNYSKVLPRLSKQYEKITNKLKDAGIEYRFREDFVWSDFGFDHVDRQNNKNELIQTFDNCHTGCREIRKNKFYFCVMARSTSENLGFRVGEEDYLALDICDNRMNILEYNLGYSEKGYLDMCNFCYGGDVEKHLILAGEQM